MVDRGTTANRMSSAKKVEETSNSEQSNSNTVAPSKRGKSRAEKIRILQKANGAQLKLSYNKQEPGYRYRWASTQNPFRITDLIENRFYEHVYEDGVMVKRHGGVTSRGVEYDLFLMRVTEEDYQLSKKIKDKRISDEEKDIVNRNSLEGIDRSSTYVPEGLEMEL